MSTDRPSLPDDSEELRRWVRAFAERYRSERERVHRLSDQLAEVKQDRRRFREQCAAVWNLVRGLERLRESIPDGPEALERKCLVLKDRNQHLKDRNEELREENQRLRRELERERGAFSRIEEGKRLGRAVASGSIDLWGGMSRGDLEIELSLWAEHNTDMEHTSTSSVRRRLEAAGLLEETAEETVRLCRSEL
jgi:hypothetical protein